MKEIGGYVLYNGSWVEVQIFIDNLRIGSGVESLSHNAFREGSYGAYQRYWKGYLAAFFLVLNDDNLGTIFYYGKNYIS